MLGEGERWANKRRGREGNGEKAVFSRGERHGSLLADALLARLVGEERLRDELKERVCEGGERHCCSAAKTFYIPARTISRASQAIFKR